MNSTTTATRWEQARAVLLTRSTLAVALLTLVATWLRLDGLRRQSLWFDEIDVVVRAQLPLDEVMRSFTRQGENGPLYNILLAIWVRLAGISEVAVRFPSAVAGILAVPLVYVLARRLTDTPTALIAAALLTISPYHVWYSQEAKMYTLVVLLALGSTLLLWETLQRPHVVWSIGWVVVSSLMFYTHVASVLVFAGQGLYLLLIWRQWQPQPFRRRVVIGVGALTLPYVPIALWASRVVGGDVPTWHPDVGLIDALRILGIRFAVHRHEAPDELRAAWLFAALALVGVITLAVRQGFAWRGAGAGSATTQPAPGGRRTHAPWLLLLLVTLVPVVGLYAVSLRNSVFSDRYALVALPFYLVLVAGACAALLRQRRLWPLALVALLLIGSYDWAALREVNRSSAAQKEDWRSAWADVADQMQPGDVVIVHPGYLITTHTYFVQRDPRLGTLPVVTIPTFDVGWLTYPGMIQWVRDQAPTATRFWLVQSPVRVPDDDPERSLERWLREEGAQMYDHYHNGVQVSLYVLDPSGSTTTP